MESIIYIGSAENRPTILDKSDENHQVISVANVDMDAIGQMSSTLIVIDLKSKAALR